MTTTGRPTKEDAYKNLLMKLNKQQEKKTCECGKITTEKRYEAHQRTMYHQQLMLLKARDVKKL